MRGVAFLRHVNQGQRGHPSTADLLRAFSDAGDEEALTFRSNGTVAFEADEPALFIEDVVHRLLMLYGLERECFWLPFAEVEDIVDAYASKPNVSRRELTLHTAGRIDRFDHRVIREATHRRCAILGVGEGWVVSQNERERESNATPVLERITEAPATSRGLSTLAHLIDRSTNHEDHP